MALHVLGCAWGEGGHARRGVCWWEGRADPPPPSPTPSHAHAHTHTTPPRSLPPSPPPSLPPPLQRFSKKLGSIPIMLKSRACYLRNLKRTELVARKVRAPLHTCVRLFRARVCACVW